MLLPTRIVDYLISDTVNVYYSLRCFDAQTDLLIAPVSDIVLSVTNIERPTDMPMYPQSSYHRAQQQAFICE